MSKLEVCIDGRTPKNVKLSGKYTRSFAYSTFQTRVPTILTKMIDQLVRDKDEIIIHHGEVSREEVKQVIGALSKLKTDVITNKKFLPICGNDSLTVLWNDFIQSFDSPPEFYTTVFLYAECYIYIRVREAFQQTSSLQEFDYFQKGKHESLIQAQFAINTVSKHICEINKASSQDEEFIKNEFLLLLKLCLWGNRCDLSISAGSDNSQTADPLASLTNLSDKTIVNDSIAIWNYLNELRKSQSCKCNALIDIVTDNAGYEFFTDLVFADFLLEHKFASQIRFLVKSIPWYISDVTSRDFHHIINNLRDDCDENTSIFGKRIKEYVEQGKFTVTVDDFWTGPWEFSRMQEKCKRLYDKLSESIIVFFKGDLNHRKLLGDRNWDVETDFKTALEEFLPTAVCTLRTIKCDLMCGIDQSRFDDLMTQHGSDSWMTTGEYAVIQCAFK